MPFDDDNDDSRKNLKPSIRQRKGLKINNETSSVLPAKTNNSDTFDGNAKEAFSRYEDYKQRTWDLSTKFKSMVEDKLLPANRSIIYKELELEVLTKLVSLASEMNADENQSEGIGGVALSMLLMKMILLQRDHVNELLFKTDKLEKALKILESKTSK